MYVQMSTKALWDAWQFATFNRRGIQDACSLITAENDNKHIYYQVDFSDLHSYIFPNRDKGGSDPKRLSLHGRAVNFLWSSILNEDPKNVSFTLVLNPGTRLEAVEALWHIEQRVRGGFDKYFNHYFPDFIDKDGNFNINNFDIHKSNTHIIQKINQDAFLPLLERIVSDDAVSREIKNPTESLINLFKNGWIHNIEDCISREILNQVEQSGNQLILQDIEAFFRNNSRNTDFRSDDHKRFHDSIDALNICFSYDLYSCPNAMNLYAPLLTHTLRVISAAESVKRLRGNNQIIHISVAALYHMRAQQLKKKMDRYFFTGKGLIEDLVESLADIEFFKKLRNVNPPDRHKLISNEHFVDVPRITFKKIEYFVMEYYNIIDSKDLNELLGHEDGSKDIKEDNGNNKDNIRIDEFVEILSRRKNAIEEVRKSAKILREKLGYLDGSLAGLYLPKEGRAKTVIDWLGGL